MAWPATVVPQQSATSNQYNALVAALKAWGGDVDAQGFKLKNLGNLDVSASGLAVNGAVAISSAAAAAPLVVSTPSGPSLQVYTGGGAANPQLRSSSGQVFISSQAATITKTIKLSAVEGAEESITTLSGRLRVAGSQDVDTDVIAGGKVQAASLTVTNAANIVLGANWTNWTPTVSASGAMTVSAVSVTDAQYLRVGALVFVKCVVNFTTGGTADIAVYVSVPVPVVGTYNALAATFQTSPLAAYPVPATGRSDSANGLVVRCATVANFALGSYSLIVSGFYRCT